MAHRKRVHATLSTEGFVSGPWTGNGRRPDAIERASDCITIAPEVDRANFMVEQDMMEVNERPPIQDQRDIEDKVSALQSPWNRAVITPILKSWLHTLPSAEPEALTTNHEGVSNGNDNQH